MLILASFPASSLAAKSKQTKYFQAIRFARSSLDVILNQWTIKPATKDGVPIDIEANVEVHFQMAR
jgi:hypothetical protein